MEQPAFGPDQQQAYRGATQWWRQVFVNLEQVFERID
jgi:hypothetical protein